MMTEELAECPKCRYKKALTHWSTDGTVNWIACPKCRSFFNYGWKDPNVKSPDKHDEEFWKHVEHDTGYRASSLKPL